MYQPKKKGKGVTFFNNIDELFSKITKQTEGRYLSYTSDNASVEANCIDAIIAKIYKNNSKLDKLLEIVMKHVERTAYGQKQFFLLKNYILFLELFRKLSNSPQEWYQRLKCIFEQIKQASLADFEAIKTIRQLLQRKIEFHSKVSMYKGNFFIQNIDQFSKLDWYELQNLSIYVQFILGFLEKAMKNKKTQIQDYMIRIVCDQLLDSLSILIFSFIAIKKDEKLYLRQSSNQKQLRVQKLLEQKIRIFLKQTNKFSILYNSHPIYMIEAQYIEYQQDVIEDREYQITSFEYFCQIKGFKGLKMPINYLQKFSTNSQKQVEQQKQKKQLIKSTKQIQLKQSVLARKKQFTAKIQNRHEPQQKAPCKTQKAIKYSEQKKENSEPLFQNFSQFIQKKAKFQVNTSLKIKRKQKQQAQEEDLSKSCIISKPKRDLCELKNDLQKSNIFSYDWLKKLENNGELLSYMPSPIQFSSNESHQDKRLKDILSGLVQEELINKIKLKKQIIIDFQQLRLSKMIGSGSAGEVFIGQFKKKVIAIKKVKLASNPNALKQFERQLLTHIRIKYHINLLSLIGLSKSGSDYYLLTQFCDSGSLFDLLHRKATQIELSWKQRVSIAIQIAKGMLALHSMKPIIIHRDLKSLNVFMAKNKTQWIAKVADFGLSRSPDSQMMTSALGTLHWMAPELLQNKQYTFKVDIYSFGILLWEICSRITPYNYLGTPMAIIRHVSVENQRPKLELITKGVPKQLVTLMQACWAKDPNLRPNFESIIGYLQKIQI